MTGAMMGAKMSVRQGAPLFGVVERRLVVAFEDGEEVTIASTYQLDEKRSSPLRRVLLWAALFLTATLLTLWGATARAADSGPLQTYLVEPCRVMDTREWVFPPGTFGPYALVTVRGRCGIPADARGVIANVTLTDASSRCYLSAWGLNTAGDLVPPGTSTVNVSVGQTRSSFAILTFDTAEDAADIALYLSDGVTANVLLDVSGYLMPRP